VLCAVFASTLKNGASAVGTSTQRLPMTMMAMRIKH
jgi:hypothetical protein